MGELRSAGEHGDLLALATDAATAAARLVREERPRGGLEVTATKSSATDIVTVMDQRAEALIVERISAARPDDGFLGEEGAERAGTSGVTWVVDPIDGTVNYLYEIPAYAVSVAVVVGDPHVEGAWRPIAGAVSDPSRSLVHHARRGGGAWTSPEAGVGPVRRLTVSGEDQLARTLLATGFGYSEQKRREQAEVLLRALPAVRDIRRIGSAALDLVRVADGSVDAYAESGINAWDLAAGWIVVEEAGGRVVGMGDQPGKELTVAAGPALVDPVRRLFR